jgi:pimeloyl-ACP methyl ester carboxylesterase
MSTVVKFIGIALLVFSVNGFASDLAKEKRWADQVVGSIMDGDAVMLNDGNSEFLGIYTEAAEDKGRAVIVMHGTGIHPDWQQVVQPLRVGLTEHNWHTLAIQMPVLPNEAEYIEYAPLYDEVAPRIEAAIEFLKDKGADNIVLVGHSQGASMPAYSLSKNGHDVAGFVAIGMGAYADDERMNSIKALEKIKIPMLDMFGSEDLEAVMSSIDDRAAAAKKAGNRNYTQVKVPGADHMFDGKEEALVEAVAGWLEKLPAMK